MTNRHELRAWRKAHGLSQRTLGQLLGVTLQCVQRWEYGDRQPPNMLHLALERLDQLVAERQGDVAAVSREQLAREAIGQA